MCVTPPTLSSPALSSSADEKARVAALDRYAILDTLPEQGYDDVTALASFICGTPISLVTLVDSGRQWFKSERGLGIQETPRSQSFCDHTIATAETLIVEDTWSDPRFKDNPLVQGEPGIRFYAGAPIVAPGGHVLGSVCVIDTEPRVLSAAQIAALEALSRQVVTLLELRRTIETNARAADSLRTVEKLAVVGRLASAVAHEINNPLQSMANLLYMAESTTEARDKINYLQQSQEELARVSHTVKHALRFHHQSGKPVATRLGELVESVLLLYRTRLTRAAATVTVLDRQSRPLPCYKSDMHQVVSNLVSNALDAVNESSEHSSPGLHRNNRAITIRIRDAASAHTGAPGIRFTVADNGSGMDSATQSRLFEPFHSTKAPRGTGLGLWVSKGILDKHDASIRVLSRPGRGTVFSIFFPLVDGTPA